MCEDCQQQHATQPADAGSIDKRVAEGGAGLNATFGQMTGYLGWAAMLDRASGRAASITYWADAESMQAAKAGNAVRARVASEGAVILDVVRMER